MRLLALTTAALFAPALAAAQSTFAGGCGTYFCLTMETGPLRPDVPLASGYAYLRNGRATYIRAISSTLTPAFAALGATRYSYDVLVLEGYRYCFSIGGGRTACDMDSATDIYTGSSLNPFPLAIGSGVPADAVEGSSYGVGIRAAYFYAYNAAGVGLASEQFAPAVVVTPEPATLALFAGGLATVAAVARRRNRAR